MTNARELAFTWLGGAPHRPAEKAHEGGKAVTFAAAFANFRSHTSLTPRARTTAGWNRRTCTS